MFKCYFFEARYNDTPVSGVVRVPFWRTPLHAHCKIMSYVRGSFTTVEQGLYVVKLERIK